MKQSRAHVIKRAPISKETNIMSKQNKRAIDGEKGPAALAKLFPIGKVRLSSSKPKPYTEAQFLRVWNEAYRLGMEAGQGAKPVPMVVSDSSAYAPKEWLVADGVCGFAWVQMAGNSRFARWALKIGIASKAHPSGIALRCREFGQSMQRKEMWAYAVANYLRTNGIEGHVCSRMD